MASVPNFRKKLESKTTAFKLQENSRQTIEPHLLTFDEIEPEMMRIR